MRGGTLVIKGNAGDWLGAHMIGGRITVLGSAGNFVGSGYRGEKQGMAGGTILIKGNAGRAVGARMKGGFIAVGGDCEEALGYGMLNGTIVVAGYAGIRVGSNMKKGTIILLEAAKLSPVFYYNCIYWPTFWRLLYTDLKSRGFPLSASCEIAAFKRYRGDANEGGDGEILICQ
ncbi:MAG: formylmethanofuran dehydrogenase subunit C [Dethiobacteria bacterium]|jgi:formylmethanofuran dehydrogenase subunit C